MLTTGARAAHGYDTLRDAILLAYILFVTCSGAGRYLGFAATAQDGSAQSTATNQIVLAALLVATLVMAWAQGTRLDAVLKGTAPFLLALTIIAASPAWSDVPDVSIRRTVRLLLEFCLLATLTASYRDPIHAVRVVWRCAACVAALDIAALAVPGISFTDIGYQGVHSHKNEAGSFALLALPIALAGVVSRELVRSRAAALLVLLTVLVIVVLSQSKTSAALAVVALGLAGVALILSRTGSGLLLMLALLVVDIILLGFWVFSSHGFRLDGILGSAGIDPTLTGRDEVWRFILSNAADRPWLGFGYGSFWDTSATSEEALRASGITFAFGQGHNGYLDVLVQIGMIGLCAAAIMGTMLVVRLVLNARAGGHVMLMAIALANFSSFWLHNITESTLLRPGANMWVFFVVLMLLAARPRSGGVDTIDERSLADRKLSA